MANNFVKWWKTKFLNGYRQFSGKKDYHLFSRIYLKLIYLNILPSMLLPSNKSPVFIIVQDLQDVKRIIT